MEQLPNMNFIPWNGENTGGTKCSAFRKLIVSYLFSCFPLQYALMVSEDRRWHGPFHSGYWRLMLNCKFSEKTWLFYLREGEIFKCGGLNSKQHQRSDNANLCMRAYYPGKFISLNFHQSFNLIFFIYISITFHRFPATKFIEDPLAVYSHSLISRPGVMGISVSNCICFLQGKYDKNIPFKCLQINYINHIFIIMWKWWVFLSRRFYSSP